MHPTIKYNRNVPTKIFLNVKEKKNKKYTQILKSLYCGVSLKKKKKSRSTLGKKDPKQYLENNMLVRSSVVLCN